MGIRENLGAGPTESRPQAGQNDRLAMLVHEAMVKAKSGATGAGAEPTPLGPQKTATRAGWKFWALGVPLALAVPVALAILLLLVTKP